MARSGGQERSGATRSHAQRAAPADEPEPVSRPAREHEEGWAAKRTNEHRTLPGVSTMACSVRLGGSARQPRGGIAMRSGLTDGSFWIIDQHSIGGVTGKAARTVEHGQPPIGIFMHGDRRLHVMTAVGLNRNLQ